MYGVTPIAAKHATRSSRVLRTILCAGLLALTAGTARAGDGPRPRTITIEVSKARVVHLPQDATTVFVADPSIADVQVPDPSRFIIFGKKPGSTRAFAFAGETRLANYTVRVIRPVSEIKRTLKTIVPGAAINVTSTPGGIVVDGRVATPLEARKLKTAASQYLDTKDKSAFNVTVGSSTQVNLRVRVAEVSRQAEKQFGFNWDALFNDGTIAVGLLTGRAPVAAWGQFNRDSSTNGYDSLGFGYRNGSGSVNVSALLDALQSEGLVSILAEPNLTTISGEPASFLAGGEIPVPVSQGLQEITIEWKRFGVSIAFTPVVLSPNRISIKVRPEVSELSNTGSVTLNNITIPSLTVRRADTTVELASGQSFAIAGLFQNNVSNEVKQFPWLSDVPVLGALFRSTSFQRNESELVIVVTPYVVKPAPADTDLHLPTEGVVYASDLEQLLLGRITGRPGRVTTPAPVTSDRPHLSGAAGFIME
jgi:pilus assembly protein CpaC